MNCSFWSGTILADLHARVGRLDTPWPPCAHRAFPGSPGWRCSTRSSRVTLLLSLGAADADRPSLTIPTVPAAMPHEPEHPVSASAFQRFASHYSSPAVPRGSAETITVDGAPHGPFASSRRRVFHTSRSSSTDIDITVSRSRPVSRRDRGGGSTIGDVAAEAGVSVATVSKVINGRWGVAEGTEARVRAVIEDLG